MKISRIEHLGIVVQSIDEVLPYFQDVLGLEVYKTEVVEDQKVKTPKAPSRSTWTMVAEVFIT